MSDYDEDEEDQYRAGTDHGGVEGLWSPGKWMLVISLVLVGAVGAGALGYGGYKVYHKFEESQLVTQAGRYMEKKDGRNALLCLKRAFRLDPTSVAVARRMAELLESEGSANALAWWIDATKLEPDNPTNHFFWAKAALKAKNLASAEEALAGVNEKFKTAAEYHKLAGALAWNQGKITEAAAEYAEALRLEPNNPANVLNLATTRLVSTNPAASAAAQLMLENLATNAAWSAVALHHLLTYALDRHDLSNALTYARENVRLPTATAADNITYLQLLLDARSGDYNTWLATMKLSSLDSPADAAALGRWIANTQNPGVAADWLQGLPTDIRTNLPVRLVIIDCQVALKDWHGIEALTGGQNWGDWEFYRLVMQALAERSLGNDIVAETAWSQALHLCVGELNRLTRLAKITDSWGWQSENTQVLDQITDKFPVEKWAGEELMGRLYANGDTVALGDLLEKMHAADPGDAQLKLRLANVLLLRKIDPDRAFQLAKEAYDNAPTNAFSISTYAYAVMSRKGANEALKVLNGLKPGDLKIPSVDAYYGTVQARARHNIVAREYLTLAKTALLLPEEREMVQQAWLFVENTDEAPLAQPLTK